MSQQSAALAVEIEGANKTLAANYLQWFDEQVAINIAKPIDKKSLEVLGASNFELSHFFEQVILKLILHKKFSEQDEIELVSGADDESSQGEGPFSKQKSKLTISPEKVGFSKIDSEFVMSIPKVTPGEHANMSSVGSGLVDLGIQRNSNQATLAQINQQVEVASQQLDEIELDVGEADYKNKQHRVLDLEKVRKRNKDFFDDETTAIQASYASKGGPNNKSVERLHGSGSKILGGLDGSSSSRLRLDDRRPAN